MTPDLNYRPPGESLFTYYYYYYTRLTAGSPGQPG